MNTIRKKLANFLFKLASWVAKDKKKV